MMLTTGRYCLATLVVASVSFAVIAQAEEPTAKDMYEAYAEYWSRYNESQKNMWEQCKSDKANLIQCGVIGTGGPMEVKILSLDKYSCKPAPNRNGNNCLFSAQVRVEGVQEFMARTVANTAGRQTTLLFRRVGVTWIVEQRSDQ